MSSPPTDTSSRILDVAEGLVQTRGFNAFSYADIAAALRITKASLHYHFPTKSKLGERLIERYRLGFQSALDQIDADTGNAAAKLQAYADIYVDVLTRDRMCLCGMLAADYATLSEPMRDEVRRFFEANEAWLLGVLRLGRERGELVFEGPPLEMARLVVATLEGAMLLARAQGKPAWLRGAASRMLAGLGVRAPAPQPVSD
ncbi:MAG TPA: TetR/AcrR family transcriptional regulator [Acetobacteraceae bacterium]|nr:TetR/AcrR family transcriptional regulator [Acetobacteraceae bacterium]